MVSGEGPAMMIRVLGPVDVVLGGRVVQVGGLHAQMLLATLVVGANHMVSRDQIAYVIWGDDPPPSRDNTVQTHLSRLRHLLGQSTITSENHSYQLNVVPAQLDALELERLVKEAETIRNEPERCRALCRQALSLWRGTPFGEIADRDPFRLEAIRLDELRLFAMELKLECDLGLDRYEISVGTLQALAEEYPYREQFWYLLIFALSRSGRRGEALRAYQRMREILGEVGLEPTFDLRELEEGIVLERSEVRPRLGPGPLVHLE